jgi:hypothetical protein
VLFRSEEILAEMKAKYPNSAIQRRTQHFINLLKGDYTLLNLREQPADVKRVDLTWAQFVSAETGWGDAQRGSVPEDGFLTVGSKVFESGLYGHATSSYVFDLGNHWKTFKSNYGIQDNHEGSVVFVVRGDGKELFRSRLITDHRLRQVEVDVTGVQRLVLMIEDGGNGNGNDWGVWIEPKLER